MRASTPPVCSHCQSTKSPLWRRGAQQEVLCNACGLYWKHHGSYRPLALKAAADRKQEFTELPEISKLSFQAEKRAGKESNNGNQSTNKAFTFHDYQKVSQTGKHFYHFVAKS